MVVFELNNAANPCLLCDLGLFKCWVEETFQKVMLRKPSPINAQDGKKFTTSSSKYDETDLKLTSDVIDSAFFASK